MSKNTRGDKEYTRLQELIHENKKLKREIASLNKQLARIDLDRHSFVKDIIDEHYAEEEREKNTDKMLQSLKNEWPCHECKTGQLQVNPYTKAGETWYYRQCNNCKNRTKGQKWHPSVKGPVKIPTAK